MLDAISRTARNFGHLPEDPKFLEKSVALITYNILISANAPLKQGFPGNPSSSSTPFSVDPIIKMPIDRSNPTSKKGKRLFHTTVTASDSVYNTWQCRVMYYWFKKFKDGPNSEMSGFTRILHSGKPDKFMQEIPTFVAQPLPAGMDQVLMGFSFIIFFFFKLVLGFCVLVDFVFSYCGSLFLWHFCMCGPVLSTFFFLDVCSWISLSMAF